MVSRASNYDSMIQWVQVIGLNEVDKRPLSSTQLPSIYRICTAQNLGTRSVTPVCLFRTSIMTHNDKSWRLNEYDESRQISPVSKLSSLQGWLLTRTTKPQPIHQFSFSPDSRTPERFIIPHTWGCEYCNNPLNCSDKPQDITLAHAKTLR